jgi:hypothetical protein
MTFIQVTHALHNAPVLINPKKICVIYGDMKNSVSFIVLGEVDDLRYKVKETPEEIIELIKQAK